jgi:hypothetical protein
MWAEEEARMWAEEEARGGCVMAHGDGRHVRSGWRLHASLSRCVRKGRSR